MIGVLNKYVSSVLLITEDYSVLFILLVIKENVKNMYKKKERFSVHKYLT